MSGSACLFVFRIIAYLKLDMLHDPVGSWSPTPCSLQAVLKVLRMCYSALVLDAIKSLHTEFKTIDEFYECIVV